MPADPQPAGSVDVFTMREVWRRYKRVPILAVAAGLIAFLASFVVPSTYASNTKVLLRGRETTLLTGTGTDLKGQPGVLDSSLAVTLGETESALLSSRAVAEEVVDRLGLHRRPIDGSGVVHEAKKFVAATYKRTRAIVTFGFYKEPPRREREISKVMEGLSAMPIKESYVLEITGSYDDPEIAAAIANTAAAVIVERSSIRFQQEATAHRDSLAEQVDRSVKEEASTAQAVAAFKAANHIADVTTELRLSAESSADLQLQLTEGAAALRSAEAKLASKEAALRSIPASDENTTRIVTGRSTTEIAASAGNPVHQQLVLAVEEARAEVVGLQARQAALRAALDGTSVSAEPLTDKEAELRQLELRHDIAARTLTDLSARYEDAVVNASGGQAEITRLDQGAVPTYPVSPVRYLYLAIGLVLGAVGGFVLSELRLRRARWLAAHPEATDDEAILDLDSPAPTRQPVGAASTP